MVCELSRKGHFLQFCAHFSKKFESVIAIEIYASESSHYPLSENLMIIIVSATIHEILAIKISNKMLSQQKSNKIPRFQTIISPKQ